MKERNNNPFNVDLNTFISQNHVQKDLKGLSRPKRVEVCISPLDS